jgi:hypothetical protein
VPRQARRRTAERSGGLIIIIIVAVVVVVEEGKAVRPTSANQRKEHTLVEFVRW